MLQTTSPDDRQEALSALMDGELSDEEGRQLLRNICSDASHRARWTEYALIGDALRGDAMHRPSAAARFCEALQAEPTVLAPRAITSSPHHPGVWFAAAATVAVLSWTIWNVAPMFLSPSDQRPVPELAQAGPEAAEALPYLVAHQDFSQAVVVEPEMQFTRVSLSSVEGGR